nr:zinc finger, CCHC-type [Tanacetum cinerariifolium]GEY53086.1 zinc finger, CCHC-type [Tanacetum cinerariifolium]GEZ24416.1 zinc finger, CCHC-type [Tanacetum cinerariifolium]
MLKSSNYSFWAIRMQIILEANGLWETIEPNEKTQADNRKDKIAIAFLYQALLEDQLLQITKYKTAKAIWNALKTRHIGEERVQQARLQTLKSELEMLHMKEDKTIDAFTIKLTTLVNKASSLGHTMEDETLVRKLLNAVPDRYLQIVASIEQYSDRSEMTFEEAIGRLKTYEERIKYKGKQVDNQDRLLFTRYEEQGRRHGHGGSNQSQGQENNFKKETHNNSIKLTHNKSKEWKEIPFNLDLTDIKQQGVSSENMDGGITKSMNQPGIKEDIHCKNSKLEGENNQKYDQPGLKEDHNNEDDLSGYKNDHKHYNKSNGGFNQKMDQEDLKNLRSNKLLADIQSKNLTTKDMQAELENNKFGTSQIEQLKCVRDCLQPLVQGLNEVISNEQ